MRVFFSFDYQGGKAYLGMKEQPIMMDSQVVDFNMLVDFLELRLGLHAVQASNADRLVAYYKCVRNYMSTHKNDADNQLYGSYEVSPLATSREMLKWRDALSICGWTKDTDAPTRRLKVLKGVEELFASEKFVDMGLRLKNIVERLKSGHGMMKDVVFVMPFDVELLHPVLKEIFELAVKDGAKIEKLQVPAVKGNDNLANLKKLLVSDDAKCVDFDAKDKSVRIWNFKDELEAEEYLAMLNDDAFDVMVQPSTKLKDNYLHMMGKPVTGSSVANSAPQIIQLFFTGVALMARPLNISALLQWLYSPISPIPRNLRYRLAKQLATNGGWCSDENDEHGCCQMVQDWIAGKAESEKGEPIDRKEQESREHKALAFLPDFEGGTEETMTKVKLHRFLTELSGWSQQRSAIFAQENPDDLRIAQLNKLSELCGTLKKLTEDYGETAIIPYADIDKHLACLYEPSEFVQYNPQATSRFTVPSPGQIVAKADSVLWAGLYDFEPMKPDTDFLTPTEYDCLKDKIRLWDSNNARMVQQASLMLPILFCQKSLVLITTDSVDGAKANKHPLIVRIEQQIRNFGELTCTPVIDETKYESAEPLKDNFLSGSDGLYAEIKRTDLINWKDSESPTSLNNLMQNPLDYVLENIAYISDNGQSEFNNVQITKGIVAHAVIQQLFLNRDDVKSGYPDAIKAKVKSDYRKVFDRTVETKGAVMQMQENAIERRQLCDHLLECIYHLIDIIEQNKLHVVACEKPLEGHTFGTPSAENPTMKGFADMIVARENGEQIIFDFKWTVSRKYYGDLLENNSSSQLAIYAELLKENTGKDIPTAYFLMPNGRLYSTDEFHSRYAVKVEVKEEAKGDIVKQIVESYRYRRDEIMSGKVEMGEGNLLESLNYFNDTEDKGLFPLKSDYKDHTIKAENDFSNYKNLKK